MKTAMKRIHVAFLLCALLTCILAGAAQASLQLPQALTSIDESAFEGAQDIDQVIIGENVKRIEKRAFAGSSVSLVIFPRSCAVEYIAPDAFEGTSGVQFLIDDDNPNSVLWDYLTTKGISLYDTHTKAADEGNYRQVVSLPVAPF